MTTVTIKLILYIFLQNCVANSIQNISVINVVSKTEQVLNCAAKIYERTNDDHTLIIFSKWEEQNIIWKSTKTVVVLQLDKSIKLLSDYGKFQLFVLLLNDVEQLKIWLKNIYLMDCWNPSGNFIVTIYNQKNLTEIMETAWKYYMININLIVFENNVTNVYTYFPYTDRKCEIDLTPVQYNCEILPKEIFPEKVPGHFNGCPINLVALRAIPYVINTSSPFKLNVRESGFEVVIMNEITRYLNLTSVYTPNNFINWGTKLPNGSYTNMYNLLQKRKVELVFGLAPIKITDNELESLQNVVYDILTWVVPTAEEYPKWTNLMFIYQIDVWLFLLFSIGINGVMFWAIGRKYEVIYSFRQLSMCLINSLSLVLYQTGLRDPKSTILRLLFIIWCFFSVIMYTVHQCKLISILTRPQYKPQITTLTEIINSKLKLAFFPGSMFALRGNPYEDYIKVRFENCSINEECVNKTAFQRHYATMKNRRQLLFFMKDYYIFPNGRPMVYAFPDGKTIIPNFNVLKGYPLGKKINKIILLFISNGLIRKWDRDIYDNIKINVPNELTALSIDHLLCGFLYLGIGLILATLTFSYELLIKKKM